MGSHPLRAAALLLGAAAALVLTARAGIPLRETHGNPVRWSLDVEQPNVVAGEVTWFLAPGGSLEEPPGADTEEMAIEASFGTWSGVEGGRVRFRQDSTRPAYDKDASDRVNVFVWKTFTLGPLTLSATYSSFSDGVMTDADLVFNDTVKFVKWSTTSPGTPGYADVQSVATHEIGHLLGIDHSPVARATMSYVLRTGSVSARSLEPDDAGAVLEAYPGSVDPVNGSLIGVLGVGRRPARRGVPVFALDARTGEPAGSAFTDDDGVYRIRALPPGPYLVCAAPLASRLPYSKWWADAPSKVVPGFLEEEGPGGTPVPRVVFTRAGYPEVGLDFTLRKPARRGEGEPDDGPSMARSLQAGGSAAGAFETPLDEDWFSFASDGTADLDLRLRSWGLGSDADPEIAVFDAEGETLLASNIDRRPPILPANANGPAGVDLDPAVEGFRPPAPGTYLVRVRAQPQSGTGGPGTFYLLHLAPSSDVPDARRTEVAMDPPATRFPGGPAVTVVVTPRNAWGDVLGPGAVVTGSVDGGGPLAFEDRGDGTYAAPLPAPAAPGVLAVSVSVATEGGSAASPGAGVLEVAGPVDAARTTLDASPRRVEADGASEVALLLVPRDAAGRRLGPGLAAEAAFEGAPSGVLGPLEDHADGTYTGILRAPAEEGSVRVTVLLDGAPTGASRLVGFGWSLPFVAADLGAEAGAAEGTAGISRRERIDFGTARAHLDHVLAGLDAGDDPAAASAAARAAASLRKVAGNPRFPGAAAAAAEVAEALRRHVRAAVDRLAPKAGDVRGERALSRARILRAQGESALATGDVVKGTRLLAAALRKARPLL